MQALLNVILPVFLVLGFGYIAAWRRILTDSAIDGIMTFAQNFAVPCMLFLAMSRMDLSADFNLPMLLSFYIGAFSGFFLGFLGAYFIFKRPVDDSIAVGFCATFSNSVLLGLSITERAFGTQALTGNFAIIAVHAPLLYAFGTTLMEISRSKGSGISLDTPRRISLSLVKNPIMIGIMLGLLVNLLDLSMPEVLTSALDLMARAALPAAIFGLGGVLFRYRPEGDMKVIAMVTAISLIAHPTVTYFLSTQVFDLDRDQLRSAVVTAAMAPGVNTYLFANYYGVAKRVAASSVLIATAMCIFTAWVWLGILP